MKLRPFALLPLFFLGSAFGCPLYSSIVLSLIITSVDVDGAAHSCVGTSVIRESLRVTFKVSVVVLATLGSGDQVLVDLIHSSSKIIFC